MDQAVQVRAALEASGLDYGLISVHDRMKTMGLAAPSVASLARIFRERGVARVEPRKRPRAAWRRFVYPAPNACWQLDATQYVLTRGRICVNFQLQDDHSRLAIASYVASGETAEAAVAVFTKGSALYGTAQRLLTDSGAALNPSRRGDGPPLPDDQALASFAAGTGEDVLGDLLDLLASTLARSPEQRAVKTSRGRLLRQEPELMASVTARASAANRQLTPYVAARLENITTPRPHRIAAELVVNLATAVLTTALHEWAQHSPDDEDPATTLARTIAATRWVAHPLGLPRTTRR